jgi:hypothetical protein
MANYSQSPRVVAGCNMSIMALRVVQGDKREPSACKYNLTTLSLGDVNSGALSSRLTASVV